jgi:hypothetical protein
MQAWNGDGVSASSRNGFAVSLWVLSTRTSRVDGISASVEDFISSLFRKSWVHTHRRAMCRDSLALSCWMLSRRLLAFGHFVNVDRISSKDLSLETVLRE